MAPRKDKPDVSNADEGPALVLEYLKKQKYVSVYLESTFGIPTQLADHSLHDYSRPYSATDISQNLHNKVSKGQATKFLKELHERKEIEGRAAGKQIVYHALQPDINSGEDNIEELATLETSINTLRESIQAEKNVAKSLNSEYAELMLIFITPEDLKSEIEALQRQKVGLVEKLSKLRKSDLKPANEAAVREAEEKLLTWTRHRNERKRIVRNLWDYVYETDRNNSTKETLWVAMLRCRGVTGIEI